MRELFVYYRIRAGAADAARPAIALMFDELRNAHPGLVARLLTRSDERGVATWMETYACEARPGSSGIDARIEAAIEARAHELVPFLDGARHVEAFDSDDAI